MTSLEDIQKAVAQLSPEEMARLRVWFEELQADQFDAQIEADMKSGKLDHHFEKALAAHKVSNGRRIVCRL